MVRPMTRVTVTDGNGVEHIVDLPEGKVDDRPCAFCQTLHAGMNFLEKKESDTCLFYCDSCWFQMGMRPMAGGIYAHLEKDALFIDERANIPACPTHDPNFGPSTPYHLIQEVKDQPSLRQAIDECLGEHGRAVTNEHLQSECTRILGLVEEKQFECLVKQGKL